MLTPGQDRQHHVFKTESFQRSENESLVLDKDAFPPPSDTSNTAGKCSPQLPSRGKNTFGLTQSLGNFRLIDVLE